MAGRVRRGVNIAALLDAPEQDGAARCVRQIEVAHAAGFDTVRLPVRWSDRMHADPPYTVDPAALAVVDGVVGHALGRGLTVVVNVHHFDELQADPDGRRDRFLALWDQLAHQYRDRPDGLMLELLNEPRDRMTASRWNALLAEALGVVRQHDRDRRVLVGPVDLNDPGALPLLALPGDARIVPTIHYYRPFDFTHQGAAWEPGADRWLGTEWDGDAARDRVAADLAAAADWAAARGLPLFLGEFGVHGRAPAESRRRWVAWVRTVAERLGIDWCHWDLATDFGLYDDHTRTWDRPLLAALFSGEP
jgi:endoglucanase